MTKSMSIRRHKGQRTASHPAMKIVDVDFGVGEEKVFTWILG